MSQSSLRSSRRRARVRGRSLARHIGAPVPLRAQAALTDGGSQAATNGVWDCQTRAVFAVVVTGPPGSGKTVTLTALSDALVRDGVAHAAVDVDEVAWAYPYPDLAQRCEHLRVWCAAHRSAGHETLLVAEVIESAAHLDDVLAALDADDHLLVRLDAALETLRQRIIVREPGVPRFRGHLTAGSSGPPVRMSVDAKDTAVLAGVPRRGGPL